MFWKQKIIILSLAYSLTLTEQTRKIVMSTTQHNRTMKRACSLSNIWLENSFHSLAIYIPSGQRVAAIADNRHRGTRQGKSAQRRLWHSFPNNDVDTAQTQTQTPKHWNGKHVEHIYNRELLFGWLSTYVYATTTTTTTTCIVYLFVVCAEAEM